MERQIYPPLAQVDLDQVTTSDSDSEWRPSEAIAAVIWIAATMLALCSPALVIAVWKWAL
jgi:hypothetical protein